MSALSNASDRNTVPRRTVYRFGNFELRSESGELFRDGARVRVQEQSLQVLLTLLENPGGVVSRDQLRERLWPQGTYVDFEHSLNAAVKRLRAALEDDADSPRYVETLPKRGYRFIATISTEGTSETEGVARTKGSPISPPAVAAEPAIVPRHVHRWGILAAVIVAGLLATFWFALSPRFLRHAQAAQKSVAVIPFINVGNDHSVDYLAVGIPDELATSLSYASGIVVRPFAVTGNYVPFALDPKKAGRDLRADAILAGDFRREGQQLEVNLQVIDTDSGQTSYRDHFTVNATDELVLRNRLAEISSNRLARMLGSPAASGSGTRPQDSEAYGLFLRSLSVPHDGTQNLYAIAMLERSVERDPNYAPSWLELAARYHLNAQYFGGGERALLSSEQAAERARQLDPQLIGAAGLFIMTQAERGRMAEAYHAAADVVRRRPDSGFAHFAMSYVLRYAGLLEESARECDQALRLDPHDYRIRSCAITFEMLGRYDRGRVFASLDPDSDSGIWRFIYLDLDQGRTSEARQLLARHSGAWPARLLAAYLDKAPPEQLAELSRRAEVVTAALIDSEEYYYNARCQAYTQNLEAALRQLRFAIKANYCSYPSMDSDPLLANIRGLSEFKELRKAGIACRETFRSQMAEH